MNIAWAELKNQSVDTYEVPDFSGTWQLDPSVSDKPEEVIKAFHPKHKRPSFIGSSMPGRNTGMPSLGGMGKTAMFDKNPFAELLVNRLDIRHSDPEIVIVADEKDEQRIFTDYRGSSISAQGGMDQKVTTARWEKDVLVIETRATGENVTTQRLKFLENPHRLERVTELPSPEPDGKSIEIKQIFIPITQ